MVGDYNKRVADLSSLISPLSSDSCWLTLSRLSCLTMLATASAASESDYTFLKREPMSLGPIKNTTSVKMTSHYAITDQQMIRSYQKKENIQFGSKSCNLSCRLQPFILKIFKFSFWLWQCSFSSQFRFNLMLPFTSRQSASASGSLTAPLIFQQMLLYFTPLTAAAQL